jgi:hypothetical protein
MEEKYGEQNLIDLRIGLDESWSNAGMIPFQKNPWRLWAGELQMELPSAEVEAEGPWGAALVPVGETQTTDTSWRDVHVTLLAGVHQEAV